MKRRMIILLVAVVMAMTAMSSIASAATYYKTLTFIQPCVAMKCNTKNVKATSYVSSVVKTSGGSWVAATKSQSGKSKAVTIRVKSDNKTGKTRTAKFLIKDNNGNKTVVTVKQQGK